MKPRMTTAQKAATCMRWFMPLILALLAAPVGATTNGITVTALTLSANFNTAQVALDYTGDDNANATVAIKYWAATDSFPTHYDDGAALVRDPDNASLGVGVRTGQRFNGDIFWLTEGTTYIVQATVTDADGVTGSAVWRGYVTTRTTPGIGSGAVVYVATTGSDATGDGSSAKPYATITKANTVVAAGGQIRVRPGIYAAGVTVNKAANALSYCSLIGDTYGGGVILDGGADISGGWTPYSGTVWSRPYTNPLGSTTTIRLLVQSDSVRLHRRVDLNELVNNPDSRLPTAGFYYDSVAAKMYVRLEDGVSPNAVPFHVPIADVGLTVTGTHWYIQNIAVRYTNGAGFLLGGNGVNPATASVLDRCTSTCNGGSGAIVNAGCDSVLIQRCTFTDPRLDIWNYSVMKNRMEEQEYGLHFYGKQVVIRNNLVRGTFDGIATAGSACLPNRGANCDVHNNTVTHVADDGFEFDTGCGINLAAWQNYLTDTNHGFSGNPQYCGPTYIIYNDIVNADQSEVKDGAACNNQVFNTCLPCESKGWVGFYHNTFTSSGVSHEVETGGDTLANKQFADNIMVASVDATHTNKYVVHNNNQPSTGFSFDYDDIYVQNVPANTAIWNWGSDYYYCIDQIRQGGAPAACPIGNPANLGWEIHGTYAWPAFVDTAAHNYKLKSTSPAIDAGQLITGIDTPFYTLNTKAPCPWCLKPRMYVGKAPDMGAHEYSPCQ